MVRQLVEAGARVTALDDLSTGFRKAVLGAKLVVGDVGDQRLLRELLIENRIDTVMHFAAHTAVSESVADPMKYYLNNTGKSRNLLACCHKHGVRNFVFSSTAAVYGIPADGLASEDAPTLPINPYGRSKLMTEWMGRVGGFCGKDHACNWRESGLTSSEFSDKKAVIAFC